MNYMVNHIVDEDIHTIIDGLDFGSFKNSTILITGANGMIASYMIYTLMMLNDRFNYGIRIVGLVRNVEKAKKHFKNLSTRKDLAFIVSDITKPLDIKGNIDYIIHAASQASPAQFVSDPVGTLKVNTMGTIHLLELAVEKKCRGFLYTSTREIYGENNDKEKVSENDYGYLDPLQVRSCYPEGKRVSETLCMSYEKQFGLPCKIVRIGHTYGYGMDLYDGRVIADLTKCAVLGEHIVLKSQGTKQMAITYIPDTVKAIFQVFLKGTDNVYNISNEDAVVSIKQIAQHLVESVPEKNLKIIFDIPPQNENTGYSNQNFGILDCTKLRELDFSFTFAPKEGLKRTVLALEEE